MKKCIAISLILVFFTTGCATVDENAGKEKGVWNTVLCGVVILAGAIAGNSLLK